MYESLYCRFFMYGEQPQQNFMQQYTSLDDTSPTTTVPNMYVSPNLLTELHHTQAHTRVAHAIRRSQNLPNKEGGRSVERRTLS